MTLEELKAKLLNLDMYIYTEDIRKNEISVSNQKGEVFDIRIQGDSLLICWATYELNIPEINYCKSQEIYFNDDFNLTKLSNLLSTL